MQRLQFIITALALVAMLAIASVALAGKPTAYAPTLTTSFQSAAVTLDGASGAPFTISGCGYSAAYGTVTIEVFTPVGVGWVAQNPDGNGCISVTNFSTVGSGTYTVDAWQTLKHNAQVVAETSFTV